MTGDAKRQFILNAAFAAIVALLAFFALKYFIWWLLPLVLGFGIAFALRPIVNAVYRFSSATRRFCAVAVLLAAYALLALLLWLGLVRLIAAMQELFLALPELYSQHLMPGLDALNAQVSAFLERFFPQLSAQYSSFAQLLTEQFSGYVSTLSTQLIAGVSGFIGRLPETMLTFLFTVLSSFFISMDYACVTSFLARLVPKRHRRLLFELKDFLVHTVLRYGRAYLILLLITFAECWAGLALLRVPGAVWWALLTAVADLLPAIGTGLVLLPWGVVALLQGNRFLGIGLFVLWGIISIVRNLCEPKVVGDNIGLHPLVTITAMFFGFQLFGVPGMFLAPLAALVLKFLNESGKIKLWDPPAAGNTRWKSEDVARDKTGP